MSLHIASYQDSGPTHDCFRDGLSCSGPGPDFDLRPTSLVEEQASRWCEVLSAFEAAEYPPKSALVQSVHDVCARFPVDGTRLLDVGCGTGIVGAAFLANGAHVVGLDILPFAVALASNRFPAYVGDIQDGFRGGSYGAVLCSMVLMLISDMSLTIKNITSCLDPGGCLYLSLLNPRVVASAQGSVVKGSRTATWRFCFSDKSVEIKYYPRDLDDYLSCLRQDFAVELIGAVSAAGALVAIEQPAVVDPSYECVWIVARKRDTRLLIGSSEKRQ